MFQPSVIKRSAVVSMLLVYVAVLLFVSIGMFSTPLYATAVTIKHDEQSMRLAELTGQEIIMESLRRHELYPYVYEEQTLILMDEKQHRDVRRIQRYSRLEKSGSLKAMIKFIYPESIAGASLLFMRKQNGLRNSRFYLPALAMKPINYSGSVLGSQMLGSEFSLEDLMPENIHAFVYHRIADVMDNDRRYFVVQAVATASEDIHRTYVKRILLIRQDNFFVTHIDYLDEESQLLKRQTRHDIRQVNGEMWRADMVMVENFVNHHRSILKIDRRVYSIDYVPASMFEIANHLDGTAGPLDNARASEQAERAKSTAAMNISEAGEIR